MRYLTIAGHRGNYKSLKGKVDRAHQIATRVTIWERRFSLTSLSFYYYFNTRAGDVAISRNS